MSEMTPVVDNHIHLDIERGRGMAAVNDFVRAGGTHLLIVNKPSWQCGIEVDTGADFDRVFDLTVETANRATERLPGRAWAILGVHPALISRLVNDREQSVDAARSIMQAGIDRAAEYVDDDRALALKSGRPHYPVDEPIRAASNDVMRRAFERAADVGCAVQLHTESTDDLSTVADWATAAGLSSERVVKHFATGDVNGVTPSVISRRDPLRGIDEISPPFFMETDFLDDPDRPGAVLGPKTVPRRVDWMRELGAEEAIEIAHVRSYRTVYHIDTVATLSD